MCVLISVSMPEKLSDHATNLRIACNPLSYLTRNNTGFKLNKNKLLGLPVWDALTLLPYSKATSRLVDRHLAALEGGDHE
jgi:hypothetical protein